MYRLASSIINLFYAARIRRPAIAPSVKSYQSVYAKLPQAPRNASPAPFDNRTKRRYDAG